MSGHNTEAPSRPFSWDDPQRHMDARAATLRPPQRIEFYAVPGSTDIVAVMVNGEPAGVLTAEQFEEVKRRIKEVNP